MNLSAEQLKEAACVNADSDVFFANEDGVYLYAEEARNTCRICPIAAACLKSALDNDMQGIWGGTDERDRKALRMGRPLPTRVTAEQAMRQKEQSHKRYLARKAREERKVRLAAANAARAGLAAQDSADLINALITLSDKVPDLTKVVATIRLNNPTKSLSDIAQMPEVNLTKDQVAGRLRRLLKDAREATKGENK